MPTPNTQPTYPETPTYPDVGYNPYSSPYGQPYGSQPPLGHSIEGTFSSGLGGLFGCGTSMVALLILCVASALLNFYLLRTLFSMGKDLVVALTALKGAVEHDKDN